MTLGDVHEVKILIKSETNFKAFVTMINDGESFKFAEVFENCQQSKNGNITKTVDVKFYSEASVSFFIQPFKEGKSEVIFKVKSDQGSLQLKNETFLVKKSETTRTKSKFFDLRSYEYDNFYLHDNESGIFEAQFNVTGNVIGEKMNYVDNLL
jgi:hypothetical protein